MVVAVRRSIAEGSRTDHGHGDLRYLVCDVAVRRGAVRRVDVARAVALIHKLIATDEPTAGLAVSIQGEIFNLPAQLRETLKLSILIITQSLHLVRHLSDRMGIMYRGEIVEFRPAETIVERPQYAYTKKLLTTNIPAG